MKKKRNVVLLCVTLALCIVAAFACVACGKKGGKATLKLDQTSVQLYVNEENAVLRAALEPADKNAKYEWSVDNTAVVELTAAQSRCTVKPLAEGTATVTVKAGKYTATCAVTVGADRHTQLAAPSFAYDSETGIITITDTVNDASKIAGYELHFFQGGEDKGTVAVTSGEAVNTRRIEKGEYTVRLVALGNDKLLLPSDPSESSATINVTLDAEYDLYDSKAILEGANRWGYYVGQWAVYVGGTHYDDTVTFEFNNNEVTTKDYWWMTQLQYNYGRLEEGKLYKMTLGINSPATGKVTINDKEVMLKVGYNEVTVGLKSNVNNGLLKMTFAVSDGSSYIKEGKFVIDVVTPVTETTTQKLVTPSFVYDKDTNIVTITDNDNSSYDVKYTLGFFNQPDDASPVGTAIVASGEEVDMSSILSGTYYLKLMAASAGMPYESSDWSAATDYSIDVSNARVDIASGGQGVSATTPNKWFEWHDSNGNGGSGVATTLDYAYQNDTGMFYVRYTVAGPTPQPLKLHYNDSAINEGDVYEFNCTIISPMTGKITVNGQIFAVEAGKETKIKVVRRQPNKTTGGGMRTTLTIQFGASEVIDEETVVSTINCEGEEDQIIVKDLEWHTVETTPLTAPTAFTYDFDANKVTAVTDGGNAEGKVSGYVLGLFDKADDAEPIISIPVVVNEDIDVSTITAGKYFLKVKAVAAALPDVDSAWSAALAEQLTIIGDADNWQTITNNGNAGANNNKGQWSKYVDGTKYTFDYAEYNGLGDVRIKYNVKSGDGNDINDDQPFKLMKTWANVATGDVYTITLKLIVPEGRFGGETKKFSVNNQVFDVREGENTLTVHSKQGSDPTLSIKFGAIVSGKKVGLPVGDYMIKDVTVTKVTPEQLVAPMFSLDTDNVITITDSTDAAKIKRYEIGLFVDGEETVKKTITVVDGEVVDLTGVPAGTYIVRIRAIGADARYIDSAWSETTATVTVAAEEVPEA
ncbi:MAG: hypothetical protein HFJ21_05500 [Clostridia bacterium]|jgi:hypothetical protein|nr:hypothetical protein [Clostridia bacterium]MCI9459897.1 hypothetical protein [Clostridia bacterium]